MQIQGSAVQGSPEPAGVQVDLGRGKQKPEKPAQDARTPIPTRIVVKASSAANSRSDQPIQPMDVTLLPSAVPAVQVAQEIPARSVIRPIISPPGNGPRAQRENRERSFQREAPAGPQLPAQAARSAARGARAAPRLAQRAAQNAWHSAMHDYAIQKAVPLGQVTGF